MLVMIGNTNPMGVRTYNGDAIPRAVTVLTLLVFSSLTACTSSEPEILVEEFEYEEPREFHEETHPDFEASDVEIPSDASTDGNDGDANLDTGPADGDTEDDATGHNPDDDTGPDDDVDGQDPEQEPDSCAEDDDCPADDRICSPDTNECIDACVNSADCGELICDLDSGHCVECVDETDCDQDLLCSQENQCVEVECAQDSDCDNSEVCNDDNICVDACYDHPDCPINGEVCTETAGSTPGFCIDNPDTSVCFFDSECPSGSCGNIEYRCHCNGDFHCSSGQSCQLQWAGYDYCE